MNVSIHPGIHGLLEQWCRRGPQKVPLPIPWSRQNQLSHVTPDMVAQIILKDLQHGRNYWIPSEILQCLTPLITNILAQSLLLQFKSIHSQQMACDGPSN